MPRARTGWLTLACLALSACEASEPRPGPVDAASLARGRALYLEHCALCHGARGDGRGPRRGSLSRPPADFLSPLWRAQADREPVQRAIRDGIAGSDMPAWRELGQQSVSDLTSYVLSLGEAQHE
jgi:cytochrome c oxidase cbb3-type subunit 2